MDITGITLAIFAAICIGLYPVFAKKIIERIGEYTCTLFNQALIVLVLGITAVFTLKLKQPSDFVIVALIFGAIIGAVTAYLYLKAIAMGSVSLVATIAGTSGILTVIFSYVFFQEPISFYNIAGMVLVIVGVLLAAMEHFSFPKQFDEKHLFEFFSSKLFDPAAGLALLVSICMVFINIVLIYAGKDIGPHKANVYLQLGMFVFLMFAFLAKPVKELVVFPKKNELKWFIPSGMLYAAAAIFLFFAITKIPLVSTAPITAASPLVAFIASLFLLKERLKARQYVGIILTIAGMVSIAL